ncbi:MULTISPECIES: hypothetical protein [Paenibacillus]|uniref:hypothetical protein n=1 Tax=Paenibacillus TaxID=44249 RepID=UPI0015C3DC57|nr:hypothetical protein [Paenibacillus odorifer]
MAPQATTPENEYKKTGQSWWYLTIIDLLDVTLLRYLSYKPKHCRAYKQNSKNLYIGNI